MNLGAAWIQADFSLVAMQINEATAQNQISLIVRIWYDFHVENLAVDGQPQLGNRPISVFERQ